MFKKLTDLMGRLQDRMDAMSARDTFEYLAMGMAVLLLLGAISSLIR